MNLDSPVVKLCIEGTRAEFEHRVKDAQKLYLQAWETARNDYEACIAAHYVARFQDTPEDVLNWNQTALDHANLVNDESVKDFYPSLYLNMGKAYEMLDNQVEAQRYYGLAAELGVLQNHVY